MFADYRFLFLFTIPIVANIISLYRNYMSKENWKRNRRYGYGDVWMDFNYGEAIGTFVVVLLFSMILYSTGVNVRIKDYTEEIGGYITEKYSVDGDHQESEEECSGTGDDRKCTTRYYTVYHTDYILKNSTGDWWGRGEGWSQRVDKSSMNTPVPEYRIPEYWKNSYVGKPISWSNKYANYISAINDDKYKMMYKTYSEYLPDICNEEYRWRYNDDSVYKAIPLGFSGNSSVFDNVVSWNFAPVDLMKSVNYSNAQSYKDVPLYMDSVFGVLGGKVQGDTYIYVVNSPNLEYADFCMAKWRGASKNGIFVFIFGVSNGLEYKPIDVVVKLGVDGNDENTGIEIDNKESRSNEAMKYDIRNGLLNYFDGGGSLDKTSILTIVFENVETKFERQEMANFKNLKEQVEPTDGWMWMMYIVVIIVVLVAHYFLSNNDS